METPAHTTRTWRFRIFQVDAREGRLLRAGTPIKIREQSFRVLVLLLEHAGELVTRDELRSALWPSDTFVDFEHGLNTAVMKLREALDDSAETPFYVETVPKRGYRFIAPLSAQPDIQERRKDPNPGFVPPIVNAARTSDQEADDVPTGPHSVRIYAFIVAAAALILTSAGIYIVPDVRGWASRLFVRSSQVHALAVLPFTNLSRDPGQEYFSDGMTDALITELGRIGGPRIISRQSVMKFKGSQQSIEEIARQLKVDAIVEGAVEHSGGRVRITVRLAQGNPERQLWAEQYDRDIRDVLAVQEDIASSVASQIKVTFSGREMRSMTDRRPVDAEAQMEYLQGLYAAGHPDIPVERAIQHFKNAIQKDSTFAPAYAELAMVYFWTAHIGGPSPQETLALSRAAASKAIQLDNSLPEAHFALGLLATSEYRWAEAESRYREALRLNPSYAECYHQYGVWFEGQGRNEEAIAMVRRAIELNPLNNGSQNQLGMIALTSRNYDQAITIFENLHEGAWFRRLAEAYAGKKRFDDAFLALDKCGTDDYCLMVRAWVSGQAGKKQDAALLLDQLKHAARQRYVYPAVFMVVYASLDDKEQALNWLDRAYEEKEPWLFWLKVHPEVDSLRSEARFQAVLRKVFPE